MTEQHNDSEVLALPSLEECTAAISPWICLSEGDGKKDKDNHDKDSKAQQLDREGLDSIGPWRNLIRRILSYGTDYDRLYLHAQTKSSTVNIAKESVGTSVNTADAAGSVASDVTLSAATAAPVAATSGATGSSFDEEALRSRADAAGKLLAVTLTNYRSRKMQQQKQPLQKQHEPNEERVEGSAAAMEIDEDTQPRQPLQEDPVISAVVEALWLVGSLLDSDEDNSTSASATASAEDKLPMPQDEIDWKSIKQVPHECLLAILRYLTAPVSIAADAAQQDVTMAGNESVQEETATNSTNISSPNTLDQSATNSSHVVPLLPLSALQTSLEPSLLQAANLLPPVANAAPAKSNKPKETPMSNMLKRIKKLNTDTYYRQHKFNLLAEESEGYAKLLTLFMNGLGLLQAECKVHEIDGTANTVNKNHSHVENHNNFKQARKQVRELIGAFDLDPNRVLDLALDALEWQLNELVQISNNETNGDAEDCWSLEQLQLAFGLKSQYFHFHQRNHQQQSSLITASRSLVEIIRELDGNSPASGGSMSTLTMEELGLVEASGKNGKKIGKPTYQGRAIAHLLGFKFHSYRARANVINTTTNSANLNNTTVNNSTNNTDSSNPTIFPRSLYLSTAFLCIHGVLDLGALLPHLISMGAYDISKAAYTATASMVSGKSTAPHRPNITSNKTPEKSPKGNIATPLMELYRTHYLGTIQRLKKLGVVSLNSSKTSVADAGGGAGNKESQTDVTSKNDPFRNDPIIGIFRALLALSGDWTRSLTFLTLGSVGVDLECSSHDGNDEDKITTMEAVALAACSLSKSIASDVRALVSSLISDVYAHICSEDKGSGSRSPGARGTKKSREGSSISPFSSKRFSLFPLLEQEIVSLDKDVTLSQISYVLRGPLTSLIGCGEIASDAQLYCRLCRLYRAKLCSTSNTSTMESDYCEIDIKTLDNDTLAILATFLVPTLSLFSSDPAISCELWSVLRNVPYSVRYCLYSSWRHPGLEKATLRSLSYSQHQQEEQQQPIAFPKPLCIIESEIETGIAARYVLKRLSKENIKDMGRQLSKVSHNNPLVVFTHILNQIESYDNLILMMVDTFKFVTSLGLDVMGYCLLLSLGGGGESGGGGRSRTKMDGLNTTQWLASLETFTGAFYKKFPDVELRGILTYLTQRFRDGQASELGVLRSLLKTAGGYGFADYDSTASLSELQLDGRCGSRLLKRETSSFGVVEKLDRKSSRHLRSFLQGGDLGVIILILLSQIRPRILYSKSQSRKEHIKVIGNMYDDCQAVLCLLLEYLSDSSEDHPSEPGAIAKLAASMPSLVDLHEKYGVDTAVAWMLCRPLVRKSIFFSEDGKGAKGTVSEEPPSYLKDFIASTPEMMASYRKLLPGASSKHITPEIFELFYAFSIYDIFCPEERYSVEITRLKKEVERLTQLQKGGDEAKATMSALAAAAAAAGGSMAQIQQATAFTKTHANELDRLKQNVNQLSQDFSRQQERCKLVHSKLEEQKDSLIASQGEGIDEMFAQTFMTFCIYPRCFLSPENSLYCAHFLKLLQKTKVPGFSMIELINNMINAATGSLYCVTEDEAGNLAILLHEIWKSVSSWRYDVAVFATDLENTPGSRLSKVFAQEHNVGDHATTAGITHEEYKIFYSQWHHSLGIAAIGCLKSPEYMHTRAALILLSRLVFVFPTQPKIGERIIAALAPLQGDDNPRPDIRATAQGYFSQLMKARDEGAWKEENRAAAKARQEKEKMKLEERRKKAEKQHEEMKIESEMIMREIADNNWRRGGRDDRGWDAPWGVDARRAAPLNVNASTFTPANGGEARELNQRRDAHDHGRPLDPRRALSERDVHAPDPRSHAAWERDRGSAPGLNPSQRHPSDRNWDKSDRAVSSRPGGQQVDASDNRRPDGKKRSRSPSTVDVAGDDNDHLSHKRSRGPSQSHPTDGEWSGRGRWQTPQQTMSRNNPSYGDTRRSSSPSSRVGRNPLNSESSQHGNRVDRRPERRGGSGRY